MIRFSQNWEKLNSVVFTTIRKNTGSKKLGQIHSIVTPIKTFKAKIIGLYPIRKSEISDILANYDADMNQDALIEMLEGWYGKTFDNFVIVTLLREETP